MYAPQTGCGDKEKIKFWEEMDEELTEIPEEEFLVGGDFYGHCGRNNNGKNKPQESMEWVIATKLELLLRILQ